MTGKGFVSVAAVLLGTVLISGCAGNPVVRTIEEFGAVGDGVQNDAPTVLKAVAAMRQTGGLAKLVFSPDKTYRLGRQTESDAQFDLSGMGNIVVDGRGATLLIHPVHGLARFYESRNIVFKNFVIQHDPLPFMQGAILSVDSSGGSFLWRIQEGFPLPPTEPWMEQEGNFFCNPAAPLPDRTNWDERYATGIRTAWQWGTVVEAGSRRLKAGIPDHFFIRTIEPSADGDERVFRVVVADPCRPHLEHIRPGERFILPRLWRSRDDFFTLVERGGWMFEQNVQIRKSADITMENLTFYSARPGMVFGVRYNDGPVTIRGCTVTWLPDSDRLIASWRDGVHCKNNRVGPLIENCHFEGLFDDSINLSADAVMAGRLLAPDRFELTDSLFEPDDEAGVFFPDRGTWETGYRVVEVDGRRVMFDRPVEGAVPGTMTPNEDIRSTQFYNLSRANDGYIVRNNFFGIQRRHAVLARCRGLIENNEIDGVCGRALEFTNESGSFYEGPFPNGLQVRGNRIVNVPKPPILIRTAALRGVATPPVTGEILLEGNRVVFDGGAPVELQRVRDLVFSGNVFLRSDGRVISDEDAVQADAASRNIQFK